MITDVKQLLMIWFKAYYFRLVMLIFLLWIFIHDYQLEEFEICTCTHFFACSTSKKKSNFFASFDKKKKINENAARKNSWVKSLAVCLSISFTIEQGSHLTSSWIWKIFYKAKANSAIVLHLHLALKPAISISDFNKGLCALKLI